MPAVTKVDVAVVGGGFTGTVFAVHLSRAAERPLDIAIIEPRKRLGHGLAYDSTDPDHRLNGPLPVHFIYPDDPGHLRDWYVQRDGLINDPEARATDGSLFIRRREFGRYVEEQLDAHSTRNASGSRIMHIQSPACSARRTADGYELDLRDRRTLSAGLVVLATGHERPSIAPPFDEDIGDRTGFVADPWNTARIREIPAHARVLVLGMAQTASDAIATLLRSGHEGPIKSISRHGLRPRRRPAVFSGSASDFVERVVRPVSLFTAAHGRQLSVRGLLSALRSEVCREEAAGGTWVGPFSDLKDSVWDVWPALPLAEKQRFLRHVRVWYDVHRFQLPPQIDSLLAAAEASQQLSFEAANCESIVCDGPAFAVALRHRGSSRARAHEFDAIVNCTGPTSQPGRSKNPFVADLIARGYAAPHPAGAGFSVDDAFRAICANGGADPHLRIVGPIAYGSFADQQGAAFIALRLCQIMPEIAAFLSLETRSDRG